jgi:6-phosphofructokinase
MNRKIGVVTGGGDCPGLNAVIRAVVKAASLRGWEVLGIVGGYEGLLPPGNVILLTADGMGNLLVRGGTILGTANRGKYSVKVGHGQERKLPVELSEAMVHSALLSNFTNMASQSSAFQRPSTMISKARS